ncbi:MAG: hypothetical protein MN733_02465, partial [Nitrososphaera sp.]|nr:hypothetical protein [Nitrososphaera sp.]
MTLSFETMLLLGIVGFYLFDSAMLLYVNELVFAEKDGKWVFGRPESGWQMLGRNLYIPNPLTPDYPLFRTSWAATSTPDEHLENIETLQQFLNALKPLRYFTFGLFALLLIGLPLVLFGFGTGLVLLLLLGTIYCTISVMLIQVYRQREEFGLSGKTFAKLVFDSLACAPFALNLVRKITLRRSLAGDPICFAHQVLDADAFAQLVQVLCHRVDEESEFE